MIKAGFIVGAGGPIFPSTVDEVYAEIALPSNEYGSTVDEIYAEISFVSSL